MGLSGDESSIEILSSLVVKIEGHESLLKRTVYLLDFNKVPGGGSSSLRNNILGTVYLIFPCLILSLKINLRQNIQRS